ncbi:hypothetical protein BRADI_4g43813v3 [Brachypodium distachyon]|uniref:Uncharacterized protein n=1 Tax=Brachypodium distachyon TaxID=15368 RepID=A0A0Q3F1P0_BRADI|nr:hypothetical protein BRADI_4g43813v3 [Brachypodium distachyon]
MASGEAVIREQGGELKEPRTPSKTHRFRRFQMTHRTRVLATGDGKRQSVRLPTAAAPRHRWPPDGCPPSPSRASRRPPRRPYRPLASPLPRAAQEYYSSIISWLLNQQIFAAPRVSPHPPPPPPVSRATKLSAPALRSLLSSSPLLPHPAIEIRERSTTGCSSLAFHGQFGCLPILFSIWNRVHEIEDANHKCKSEGRCGSNLTRPGA